MGSEMCIRDRAILEEAGFQLSDLVQSKKDKDIVVRIDEIDDRGQVQGFIRSDDGTFNIATGFPLKEIQDNKWVKFKEADPEKYIELDRHQPIFSTKNPSPGVVRHDCYQPPQS